MHIEGVAPLHVVVSALPFHQVLVRDEPEKQHSNHFHTTIQFTLGRFPDNMLYRALPQTLETLGKQNTKTSAFNRGGADQQHKCVTWHHGENVREQTIPSTMLDVTSGSDRSYGARACQAAGRPCAEQVAGAWCVCRTGKDTSVPEQGSRVAGSEIRKETGPEPVATVAFTLGEIRSHLTYCFDQVPLVANLRTDSRDERKRRPVGGEEQDGSSGVVTYCT